MAVRVLIFEDNDFLRESLASLIKLNDAYVLAGSHANVMTVKTDVQSASPNIIIMDIDMPGMTGIEAVKIIRTFNTEVPILMLTVFDDNEHVFEAIKAGASGYLLKKHITNRLFTAMEEALDGGSPLSPSIARMIITSMQTQHAKFYNLSPRETEILSLLSKGESYKMIANQLGISLDTVRTHIKKIYEKLHVHSQTEAVSKAIRERLV
jgi:DNA-binding NarL/FixJ family response regulator